MTVWPLAVACALLLLAAVGVYHGVATWRELRRLLVEGIAVDGCIAEIFRDVVNEDWTARVRYAVGGATYTVEIRSWDSVQPGQVVALRYLPSNPARARRYYPGFVWKEAIASFVLAAILAVAATVLGVLASLGVL